MGSAEKGGEALRQWGPQRELPPGGLGHWDAVILVHFHHEVPWEKTK